MRKTKPIDATVDDLEQAKNTAVSLIDDLSSKSLMDLFYSDSLDEVEYGIRSLSSMSNRSWILSAMLLYAMVYDQDLYKQSGLDWATYAKNARERLGLDPRDVTEQLSAARFFIKNHEALEKAGWTPDSSNRKLARAELAYELSGDLKKTIKHIAEDTFQEFKDWYSSYKKVKKLIANDGNVRDDISIGKKGVLINGLPIVEVNKDLSKDEQEHIKEYLSTIYTMIKNGYEPAIIAVYDKKEAKRLERLRDKDRQGR